MNRRQTPDSRRRDNALAVDQCAGVIRRATSAAFADRNAAKLWIIDNQFGRRNLPDIDCIALATKREAILKPIAAKSMAEKVAALNRGRAGKLIDGKIADNGTPPLICEQCGQPAVVHHEGVTSVS